MSHKGLPLDGPRRPSGEIRRSEVRTHLAVLKKWPCQRPITGKLSTRPFMPPIDMDFAVCCPLVPRLRLLSGSCPSTRAFAPRFLRTPPRSGSPCASLPFTSIRLGEDFHLQAAEHAQHTTKRPRRPRLQRNSARFSPCQFAGRDRTVIGAVKSPLGNLSPLASRPRFADTGERRSQDSIVKIQAGGNRAFQ